jgi:hypothetical protein
MLVGVEILSRYGDGLRLDSQVSNPGRGKVIYFYHKVQEGYWDPPPPNSLCNCTAGKRPRREANRSPPFSAEVLSSLHRLIERDLSHNGLNFI